LNRKLTAKLVLELLLEFSSIKVTSRDVTLAVTGVSKVLEACCDLFS